MTLKERWTDYKQARQRWRTYQPRHCYVPRVVPPPAGMRAGAGATFSLGIERSVLPRAVYWGLWIVAVGVMYVLVFGGI